MKILLFVSLILGGSFVVFAQINSKTETLCLSNRLDSKKPSAYITFEKFDKRKPFTQEESNEGVWLRFHNNTKWKIYLKTFGNETENNSYKIPYQVKLLPSQNSEVKESQIPKGYRLSNSVHEIESGKSLLFSIPKEHLANGFYITIDFSYDWELTGYGGGGGLEIAHQVSFLWSQLPDQ
jgi:hypothetical protein